MAKAADSEKWDGIDNTATFQLNLSTASWTAYNSNRLGGNTYNSYIDTITVQTIPVSKTFSSTITFSAATFSGRVGIGTTNPIARFEVVGGSATFRGSNSNSAIAGFSEANGNYKMLITTSGNVGIGTPSPDRKLVISDGQILIRGNEQGVIWLNTGSSSKTWDISSKGDDITFNESGITSPLYLKAGGNVGIGTTNPGNKLVVSDGTSPDAYCDGNSWVPASSIRVKENIVQISGAMDRVKELRGVYFDWKETGKHDIGMIAEEVGKVIPEVVDWEEDGKFAKGLNYDHLIALLIEAIKEQQLQIEALKKELNGLE
jgi:hypothetical protein